MRCGGSRWSRCRRTLIEPLRLPIRPRIARSVLVRPGAVAAEQRDDLALVDVQVDAVQHVRLAVPGVQVARSRGRRRAMSVRSLQLGVRRCPCRPRSPPGSSTPAAYGPSASVAPRCSTVIVSAMLDDHAHVVLDHQHRAAGRRPS